MKTKLLIAVISILISAASFGQNIVNPSFEDWVIDTLYQEPNVFSTTNLVSYLISGGSNVSPTTDSYSGQYAARLQTVAGANDTMMGMVFIGAFGSSFLEGGLPYSDRPQQVEVSVKYNLMASDTASATIFFKRNGMIAGFAQKRFYGVQNTYQKYTANINWMIPPGEFPDTMLMIASSSNFEYPAIPGSYLIIDDVRFPDTGVAQIPGGDFENWTAVVSEEPVGWNTVNRYLAGQGSTSATSSIDSWHGNKSLRLETKVIFSDTMGFITNGRLPDGPPSGGLAVNANPYKVTGYYKYLGVGSDNGLAALFAWATDSLGNSFVTDSVIIALPPASSYTAFELELTYNGWPRVDTLSIIFSSSNLFVPSVKRPGSTLYLDSLNILYHPLSIHKKDLNPTIKVFPNPFKDKISLIFGGQTDKASVTVYDYQGRMHYNQLHDAYSGKIELDLGHLPKSVYIIEIRQNGITSRTPLIKQ